MTGVDLDRLADFVGGALDGTPDADRIRDLVAAQPAWASAYQRLVAADATVSSDLAAFGAAAEPMPPDIADRLEAALAAAAKVPAAVTAKGASATATAKAAPTGATADDDVVVASDPGSGRARGRARRVGPGRGPVLDGHGPGRGVPRRRLRRRWASLVGAVAVIVVGLAAIPAISDLLNSAPSTSAGKASSADRANSDLAAPRTATGAGQQPARIASGTDYTRSTVTSAAAAAAPGSRAGQKAGSQSNEDLGAPSDPRPNAASGGAPAGGSSAATPKSSSRKPAGDATAGPDVAVGPEQQGPRELERLASTEGLAPCLAAVVARHGGYVTLVDFARFEGQPAVLAVLANAPAGNGGRLFVVVGPSCGLDGQVDERYAVAG